jgi:hypothetical protein
MTAAGVPTTPLWHANGVRAEADKTRAEWLVSLHRGYVSAGDLFEQACTTEGRPLLRLPLRQILLAQGGVGAARAARILTQIKQLVGVEMPYRNMTVAWLLDSRVGGRRFLAWLDVTRNFRSEPWSGFPYRSPFSAAGPAAMTKNKPGDAR